MTTTCAACGAQDQSGAFCTVCGTPTVATGVRSAGPVPSTALESTTTEPEARGMTRQAPADFLPDRVPPQPAEPPLAGVGRRVGAYLLDALAVSLLAGVVAAVLAVAVGLPDRYAATLEATTQMGAEAAGRELLSAMTMVSGTVGLVGLLSWLGLAVWEGRTGATIGNRLLGIRTHDAATGAPAGVGRVLLRWLVVWLCGIVPLLGTVLVLISPLFDSGGRRQGWHDKAARTVVHDVRSVPPRSFAPAVPPTPMAVQPVAPAPVVTPAATGGIAPHGVGSPDDLSATQLAPAVPSSATPDPWGFPSGPRSGSGLITGIPGAGTPAAQPVSPAPQPSVASPAPAPAPVPVPAPAPIAAPAATTPDDVEDAEDIEATRFSVSSRRGSGESGQSPATTSIDLPSGERVRVAGRTLLGRNPQPQPGGHAELLRVDDPTRSVSKTHLELVPTDGGLRLTDLGSTNGTAAITPDGEVRELAAGSPVTITAGWAVQAGDLRFTVVGSVDA